MYLFLLGENCDHQSLIQKKLPRIYFRTLPLKNTFFFFACEIKYRSRHFGKKSNRSEKAEKLRDECHNTLEKICNQKRVLNLKKNSRLTRKNSGSQAPEKNARRREKSFRHLKKSNTPGKESCTVEKNSRPLGKKPRDWKKDPSTRNKVQGNQGKSLEARKKT